MTKKELRELVVKHIDQVFLEYMDSNNIKTGDITPLQALDLERKIDLIVDIVYEVSEQNREVVKCDE